MAKIALVTGITGQDGNYITRVLLHKGYQVYGTLRPGQDPKHTTLPLPENHPATLLPIDLLDKDLVKNLVLRIKPDEIYHLAAQSSPQQSHQRVAETITFNTNSLISLLGAIEELSPNTRIFNASSADVFKPDQNGVITCTSVIAPSSPYSISKATNHLLVDYYRNNRGIFAVNGILFPHESILRNSNSFVKRLIKWAVATARGGDELLHVGNIDNQRDFGYAPLFTQAMWLSLQTPQPNNYVICSGVPLSLRSIIEYVLNKTGVSDANIVINPNLAQQHTALAIYGDNSETKKMLEWDYSISFFTVLDEMLAAEINLH